MTKIWTFITKTEVCDVINIVYNYLLMLQMVVIFSALFLILKYNTIAYQL